MRKSPVQAEAAAAAAAARLEERQKKREELDAARGPETTAAIVEWLPAAHEIVEVLRSAKDAEIFLEPVTDDIAPKYVFIHPPVFFSGSRTNARKHSNKKTTKLFKYR